MLIFRRRVSTRGNECEDAKQIGGNATSTGRSWQYACVRFGDTKGAPREGIGGKYEIAMHVDNSGNGRAGVAVLRGCDQGRPL